MPKGRRRLHHDDSKEEFDQTRKRRRVCQYDAADICQELYDTIRNQKTHDGRLLCESFIRAPKRRNSADYYDVVSTPIDLLKIQQKLKTDEYVDVGQMTTDIELMVNNAKMYYKKFSQEYKDACQIWDLYIDTKNQLLSSTPTSHLVSTPSTASRKESADNADCSENTGEELNLRRSYGKRAVSEQSKVVVPKSSERIRLANLLKYRTLHTRAKRMAGVQSLTAIATSLQYESEAEEEEEVDEDDDGDQNPVDANDLQWQLYLCVVRHKTNQDYQLAEPFLRLPSRKSYPDYYKEILHPMSLLNIRSRIRAGQYENVADLVDDLNLMFDNAKQYNLPGSRIYKDAVKLQKIMQAKGRECINLEKVKIEKFETKQEEGSESESTADEKSPAKKGKKSVATATTSLPEERRKSSRRSADGDAGLKKRLKIFYKTLIDFVDGTGRSLITLFMEKPSKKDYPDYYQIITEPIDMKTIEHNIKNDKYCCEEDLIADFRLMFNNCHQYNEEESQIYRDADTLEKALMDKVHEIMLSCNLPRLKSLFKSKGKLSPQLLQKLQTLYNSVKDYSDSKGRKLSTAFVKLPSKQDYPDYFDVIRKPVDMQRIHARMLNMQYETVEEMLSDYVLMFDNACKYNESESQIYKDALTLQRVALQAKMELTEDEDGTVPDVRPLVQELLVTMYNEVFYHHDEEGRCYVDSLAELTEFSDGQDAAKVKTLSLEIIKKTLDKGKYRRLDQFQDDIFDVFERARKVSRTDSQVFEDTIELQSFFIKRRDELCKSGEVLFSPALRYSENDLQASIDALRREKVPCEKSEDEREQDSRADKEQRSSQNNSDSVHFREQTYHVGDFVYMEPREKGLEPHIILIEKLWKDDQGEQWLYGCWFYRPNETFHLATRKFLEKEVFKSDNFNSAPMNQVQGKCCVMFVKDYFKYRPGGFADKDVYVCETRYSAKAKAFKKIKIWPVAPLTQVKLIPREEPLEPIRVPSVFRDRVEKVKEESNDSNEFDNRFSDKDKPNIITEGHNANDDIVYYEQYVIPAGCFRQGDCVYVQSEAGRRLIARIDSMWVEKSRGPFFHGPWFVTCQDIVHPPTRLFFKQEVFQSSIEDTNPLLSITGHCAVLELKDFCRCRPTEILEPDVFVCESRYMEAERQIRKLTKGLKKYALSDRVTEDEIYYFRKPINPQKEPSPLLPKVADVEMEDSNDGGAPSIGSNESFPLQTSTAKKKPMRRLVTGYILFSGDVRKNIIAKNPDATFGDISRLVGTEWRGLPQTQKTDYEERAQKMNDGQTGQNTVAHQSLNDTMVMSPSGAGETVSEDTVHICQWDKCDFQFEDQQDILEHVLGEPNGHVYQAHVTPKTTEFHCLWHNCARVKKNAPPFPNIQRLLRHCKEVHIKTSMKIIPPADRSKNFVKSRSHQANNPAVTSGTSATAVTTANVTVPPASTTGLLAQSLGQTLNSVPFSVSQVLTPQCYSCPALSHNVVNKPLEPVFVAVPPKPQRLVHSEAYIKYIEGLSVENRTVSNWDVNLKANRDNTFPSDPTRLPVHWLGNGVGNHGNTLNALWALRDYMMKDALNISKVAW